MFPSDPVAEQLFQAVLEAAQLVGKHKMLVERSTFGMKPFHEAGLKRAEELLEQTTTLYRSRLLCR